MKRSHLAAALGAVLCLAAAADPGERLGDPRQEARARALFRETRCLVCQGESIDDSESDLAADLRRIVRRQVAAGASDAQVRAFLAARYGEFVLLRPPFSPRNAILWLGPFALVGVGMVILASTSRSGAAATPLSAEEETRIADLAEEKRP